MHLLAMKEQSITQLRQRLEDSEAKLNRLIPDQNPGPPSMASSIVGQPSLSIGTLYTELTLDGAWCAE